jgi:hypothetical protein
MRADPLEQEFTREDNKGSGISRCPVKWKRPLKEYERQFLISQTK